MCWVRVEQFYVKFILSSQAPKQCEDLLPGLSDTARSRVHVFNSFFLKRLKSSLRQDTLAKKNAALEKLMRWVQADLLEKDFIFVPVHEQEASGHWALAVICFPGLVVKLRRPPPLVEGAKEASPKVEEAEGAASDVLAADSNVAADPVAAPVAKTEEGGGGGSGGAKCEGRPCLLFLDSHVTNQNKALFGQLRSFLEFYWKRMHQAQVLPDHPLSGSQQLPPPPTYEHGEPPPARPKVRYSSGGGAAARERSSRRRTSGGGSSVGADGEATAVVAAAAADEEEAAVAAVSGRRGQRGAARKANQQLSRYVDAERVEDVEDVAMKVPPPRVSGRRNRASDKPPPPAAEPSSSMTTAATACSTVGGEATLEPMAKRRASTRGPGGEAHGGAGASEVALASTAAPHPEPVPVEAPTPGTPEVVAEPVMPPAPPPPIALPPGMAEHGVGMPEQEEKGAHQEETLEASENAAPADDDDDDDDDVDVIDDESGEGELEEAKLETTENVDMPASAEDSTVKEEEEDQVAAEAAAAAADGRRQRQGRSTRKEVVQQTEQAEGSAVAATTTASITTAAPAAGTSRSRSEPLPSPEWFTSSRLPGFVLGRVPQQSNEYDCGLYMLRFVEELSRTRPPSFASADELSDFYHARFFTKQSVDDLRINFHRALTRLAKDAGVMVHRDDDGEKANM